MAGQTIHFTPLELQGLWVRATGGVISSVTDPLFHAAAENAINKVFRAKEGMPKRPTPPRRPKAGPPILVGKGRRL